MSIKIEADTLKHDSLNCRSCKEKDGAGNSLHLADIPWPEWQLPADEVVETHKGLTITLAVARKEHIPALLAAKDLIPAPEDGEQPDLEALLQRSTDFAGYSHPYVIIVQLDGQIVGRLYLERNHWNAMRHELKAAVIDGVSVSTAVEEKGIAGEMLNYAEKICADNEVNWVEIGAVKAREGKDEHNKRRGTDSLSLYVRRGYIEHAVVVEEPFMIHYRQQMPGGPTAMVPRYDCAVVMYKDLQDVIGCPAEERQSVCEQLVALVPEPKPE